MLRRETFPYPSASTSIKSSTLMAKPKMPTIQVLCQFLREVGERDLKGCLPGTGDAAGAVDLVNVGAVGTPAISAYLLAFELLPSPA